MSDRHKEALHPREKHYRQVACLDTKIAIALNWKWRLAFSYARVAQLDRALVS